MTAVGSTFATFATASPQLPVVSSSAAHTCTVKAPLSPYWWVTEKLSVAFGRVFSSAPDRATGAAPSSYEIVAVSGSSQPGSVTVPVTVTVPCSSIGVMPSTVTVGATLVTVTCEVLVAVLPKASVTSSPIGKVPSCPTRVKLGVAPVASSYCPSPSRSHAYVAIAPADGSVPAADPVPSRVTSVPSGVVYGPPASATGTHPAGTASLAVGTWSRPPVEPVPRPRPANALQIRQLFAPPSALSSPSRASMNVGLADVAFIPSSTRSAIASTPPGYCLRMS